MIGFVIVAGIVTATLTCLLLASVLYSLLSRPPADLDPDIIAELRRRLR